MSPLRQYLCDYLTVRRTLGFKLYRAEKLLEQFVTYIEARGGATSAHTHVPRMGHSAGKHSSELAGETAFAGARFCSSPPCDRFSE